MRQRVRRRYCLTLALCTLSFAGCGDAGEPEQTTQAQRVLPTPLLPDSAGVQIIEYPMLGAMAPDWAAFPNPLPFTLADLPPAVRLESQSFPDLGGIKANAQEEFNYERSA